ncbi:MAG: hypothetical protein RMM31_11750, partial [Anaerolineae bacterium]|nr:hypothetical protein [Anaerolineae bacterium]
LQQGIQQGTQQGFQQGLRDALARVLAARFGDQASQQTLQVLVDKLPQLKDPAQLNELLTVAARAPSIQAFSEALEQVLKSGRTTPNGT